MVRERVDISILVVDDDDTSLASVANILVSLDYKVLIANGAHNALKTLREFEGFFDLVITELHISGMNGFEFQKRVKNEFHLPVIMMSADSSKSVVTKSLENGAAHFILKPICKDDFKDIWQYVMAARKGKATVENIEVESQGDNDKIVVQDVNSSEASSLIEPKRKRKYGQRNNNQMNKEDQSEGSSGLVKKQKVVWTSYLHNLFLVAIKQVGLDRAVPKRILQIMNVPNLTRENVASHLQKYRIFMRKVAEKGLIEGLSDRTLRSRFASGLSASLIRDIQTRTAELRVPVQQYLRRSLAHQTETGGGNIANAMKPFNNVSGSAYVISPLAGRGHNQFPFPLHKGLNLMLQNQHGDSLNDVARLGVQSRYGSNVGANNIQQKMAPYQAKSSCNAGSVFPAYGIKGHGLMTSTDGLTGGLRYGEPMYQNYCSLENNHNFSYGQGNWNSSNNQAWNWANSIYNPSTKIQLNGGSKMVGNGIIKGGFNNTIGTNTMDYTTNKTSFGLINGTTKNTNMNVASSGHGNFGWTQGGCGLILGNSKAGIGWSCEPSQTLITNGTQAENSSGIPQLPQQLGGSNVKENEHQYNATSISEGLVNHMEDDLSEIFLVLDEMNLLNEIEENPNGNEYLKSNISSPSHVEQSLEQSNRVSEEIVNPTKSTLNLSKETPTSSDKNSNQLVGDEGSADSEPFDRFMVDDVSSTKKNDTMINVGQHRDSARQAKAREP
ncbi:hypothetical protein VNO77_33496 [Canavalia gladiata]|uniref:Response regulatory domain-containing protein n=1 Tax=Canavalia gladiata TaxID=3824 RepID=A0AAN9KFS6_CANGL